MTHLYNIKKLAISIGEPAGIGPDLIIKLAQEQQEHILIIFADSELLKQRAKLLDIHIELIDVTLDQINNSRLLASPCLYIIDNNKYKPDSANNYIYKTGILNELTAKSTLEYLYQATMACINKYCDALVTCPIQKSNINAIESHFMGHTEYLEQLCNLNISQNKIQQQYKSIMMLMSRHQKVALVTTHLPLVKIAENITQNNIINITKLLFLELKKKFKISNPHIKITGLNPHAGENGKLGTEEIDIIIPAIKKLQAQNIEVSGPYAADSLFSQDCRSNEVILAMYHDQGLTGFKAKAFNTAVNITLGLPIIRTSVDHGTALELAGTGNIKLDSIRYAIEIASVLSN